MNIKHLESIVIQKLCPVCSIGMVREIGGKVYQCSRARCGETFNFSLLSDETMQQLLDSGRKQASCEEGSGKRFKSNEAEPRHAPEKLIDKADGFGDNVVTK